ncbi:MAG: diaminopimelate decarboxylase [Gemmatimonadaceae bacterium]|nr:diaminopimelate decarboxylase [Gemmatimonadaceae bacterium]
MGESVLTSSPAFGRVDGTLHGERVALDALAAAVGTPVYAYSSATIAARFARLDAVLAPIPHRIHYACKANGNLAILSLLRSLGARVDVVSGGELFRARRAGFAGRDIIFGGVGKSEAELGEALDAGVHLVSVESATELRMLDAIARERGVVARVGLRVNPEVAVESFHDYIKTGQKGNKFGVPYDQADAVARLAMTLPNVALVAIGMHIGSQLSQLQPYGDGIERLEQLITSVRAAGVDTLEHVDIGGGIFVPYDDEPPADLDAYASLVVPAIRRIGLELIVEPGRFLVAESGVLLTRVLYRKRSGGRELLITDAGMTDLLRPSHYDAYHRISAVHHTTARATFDVVGPICESGDFLAIDREMDDVDAGALLCVWTAGAYGSSMSSNYNARPRAAEVLLDGDRWAIVTARERYEDLVRRETTTPQWRTT